MFGTTAITLGVICLVLVIFWCWTSGLKGGSLPFRESLYFQVIDDHGNQSIVHDSGQDPTLQELRLQILKREINDKRAVVLITPKELRLGSHPEDLDQTVEIHPQDIEDHGDYYVVKVVR